jgi:hypothetical protein
MNDGNDSAAIDTFSTDDGSVGGTNVWPKTIVA